MKIRFPAFVFITAILLTTIAAQAAATPLTSTHYRLDPNVGSTFGGQMSATDYKLTDAGGEAAIGTGSSPAYQLGAGFVSQLIQSIQLSILPNSITAYYPLDTGSGDQAYDVGANNLQGSITGSPTWTTGKSGNSLSLNGSNQYITIPHNSALNLSDNFTLTAWVKLSDYSANYPIISKRVGTGSTNTTYELRVQQTTGQIQFLSYDTSLKTVTGTTQVPTGSWAQIAAIKQSGVVRLYLNGSLVSSAVAVSTPTTGTTDLKIGSTDDLTSYFKGGIDEVRLYNRALSASELLADIAAVSAGSSSAQAIPNVTPGQSQTASSDIIVRTDAPGYNLAISQNHDLLHTDGTTTIPAVSGSIASPVNWSEGSTKGLAFTVIGGTSVESSWGTSPNYQYPAIPSVATSFHSRTGFSGGSADTTSVQYRLDTSTNQKSGSYSNTVTISATLKP